MKLRIVLTTGLLAAIALPLDGQAQGLINGTRDGYHEGDRVAGPIGGVVGGAVGAGVGTVNGALGIGPRHFYRHRCFYRDGRRHCR